MMYIFFKIWTYPPSSPKVSLTYDMSYEKKNEPSEILVLRRGEALQFNFFLNQKISPLGKESESECKSQVQIYVRVLAVATAHTKDSFFCN